MTSTQIRPTRRTLVRGAAWSVPVVSIAAAAPAFAASACNQTLNWASLGNGAVFSSTTVAGITITLSLSGATTAANNRTVSTTQTGGQTSNLRFYSTGTANSSQTATFTFTKGGQPFNVTNLSFSFLDIDSGGASWDDRVWVGTAGFTRAIQNTTYVTGTGVDLANAFRGNGTNTSGQVQGGQTNGNVQVTWAAALNSVSFTYAQDGTANGSPFIGISNMSFTAAVC
ncbi:hypothetical protein [Nocardioides currus]|uniref:Uncharacterized protein n=1 Tax=Nocardioides currus TaxID=2133958 RepID=A0A2R7YYV2_9ACTN|nr:hypothetical protein [Nocardioides currus]PUA81542.1 hypothetical protein C7S10_05540 [Nocardioides currus]